MTPTRFVLNKSVLAGDFLAGSLQSRNISLQIIAIGGGR